LRSGRVSSELEGEVWERERGGYILLFYVMILNKVPIPVRKRLWDLRGDCPLVGLGNKEKKQPQTPLPTKKPKKHKKKKSQRTQNQKKTNPTAKEKQSKLPPPKNQQATNKKTATNKKPCFTRKLPKTRVFDNS